MIFIKTFQLQPLRISTGWKVKYNVFSEYDVEKDGEEYAEELCEDLLQLEKKNLLIDLGWYPEGDMQGSYQLYLVDKIQKNPFASPLKLFTSRSKTEIIEKIEKWTAE